MGKGRARRHASNVALQERPYGLGTSPGVWEQDGAAKVQAAPSRLECRGAEVCARAVLMDAGQSQHTPVRACAAGWCMQVRAPGALDARMPARTQQSARAQEPVWMARSFGVWLVRGMASADASAHGAVPGAHRGCPPTPSPHPTPPPARLACCDPGHVRNAVEAPAPSPYRLAAHLLYAGHVENVCGGQDLAQVGLLFKYDPTRRQSLTWVQI